MYIQVMIDTLCGKFDSYSVHRGTSNNKEGTANTDSGLPGRLEMTPPYRLVEQLKQQ